MDYEQIVRDEVAALQRAPIQMLGDATGGHKYLNMNLDSYVRTVRDLDALWPERRPGRKILEIGSFLGVASFALKKMGFDVWAADIPEYHELPALRALYERQGVPFAGVNLRERRLPYAREFFDAVILCEVVEHLNFNPLPVLLEINRTIKPGGFLYVGMPNQTHIVKRLQLLRGRSIHNPIDHFFKQLDRNDNVVVGLHWREYTLSETIQLIESMGFRTTRSYYFANLSKHTEPHPGKRLVKALLNTVPSFRPAHVVIGQKVAEPVCDFWLTDANT